MAKAENMVDKNQTGLYGEALLDYGICVRQAVNGYGLETFGLVWQGPDIWITPSAHDGVTTTWTSSETAITTTWTPSTVFGYGNEFPEMG
jgi:hypothetical protein